MLISNTHCFEVKEMLLLNSLKPWILGILKKYQDFCGKIECRPHPLVASWENKCIRDTAHCSPKRIASYIEDNTLSCLSLSPCFHRLSAKKLEVLMLCIFNLRGGSESENKNQARFRDWNEICEASSSPVGLVPGPRKPSTAFEAYIWSLNLLWDLKFGFCIFCWHTPTHNIRVAICKGVSSYHKTHSSSY